MVHDQLERNESIYRYNIDVDAVYDTDVEADEHELLPQASTAVSHDVKHVNGSAGTGRINGEDKVLKKRVRSRRCLLALMVFLCSLITALILLMTREGERNGLAVKFRGWFDGAGNPDKTTDDGDDWQETTIDATLPQCAVESIVDVEDRNLLDTDTAMYWRIPKTAGGALFGNAARCLDLIEASEAGASGDGDTIVVETSDENSYVNVDTTTVDGIDRAKRLGLAKSGVVDVIVTPLLQLGCSLFGTNSRGRIFTFFGHPVDRAARMFYDPEFQSNGGSSMTLEEYAASEFAYDNWMIRQLIGKIGLAEVNDRHLAQAKEYLRRKVLIGLDDKAEDSIWRFSVYFGWILPDGEKFSECCQDGFFKPDSPNEYGESILIEGSDAWTSLLQKNVFDMQLYEYAKDLFEEQKSLFTSDDGDQVC